MRNNPFVLNVSMLFLISHLIFVQCTQAQTMKFVSSKVEPITSNVAQDGDLVPVQRLVIITKGTSNPLSVTRLSLNTKPVFLEAKVYYTNGVSSSSKILFGDSNATMKGAQTLTEGLNYFWIYAKKNYSPEIISFDLGRQDYKQIWADEFNADTINTNNWSFENGFVRNEEDQWYQKENASCKNGILTIEAKREKKPNPNYVAGNNDWRKSREFIEYTSTSMLTRGKQQWQYGRFEMRARIDTAIGYWPAWWTLGVDKRWPQNGEIDIMEYYKGKVLANIAVADANPGKAHWWSVTQPVHLFAKNWKEQFHTWRMDWDEKGVGLYLDDILLNYQPQNNLFNRNDSAFYPFKQPHYMLLNLAIGGINGGDPSSTIFPLKFEVDYVRVSQKVEGKFTPVGTFKPLQKTIHKKNSNYPSASKYADSEKQ